MKTATSVPPATIRPDPIGRAFVGGNIVVTLTVV
jgi:hypothetical protein